MTYKAHPAEPNTRAFAPCQFLKTEVLKTAALASALFIPLTGTLCAKTVEGPAITVNGTQSLIRGLEKDNSTFVPIDGIFDKIGAKVTFTAPSSLRTTKGGSEIARLTVGSRTAVVKGVTQHLAAAPFIRNGTVMVPLRFLSEAAGASVAYSASPRGVQVTGSSETAPATKSASAGAAAGAASATAAPAAAAQTTQSSIPWWAWLLAALIIIGIVIALMRRKKEPIITTTGMAPGGGPVIKTRH